MVCSNISCFPDLSLLKRFQYTRRHPDLSCCVPTLTGKLLSPLRKVFFAEISLDMPIDFQRVANL